MFCKKLFINLYCALVFNKTKRQKIRRVLLNQDHTCFSEQQNQNTDIQKQYNSVNEQVQYLKEHCDVRNCKPATGDLRKYQLEIVKFAADFFKEIEKLGIKPFLISGNLLGHVRHNGFVPWDDDLDFGLMRDDYEKLIKYCF